MGFTAMLAHERIEVEDTAVACLRFKSGALGVIQATTSVWPGLPKTIGVHGDKAVRSSSRTICCAGSSKRHNPRTTTRSGNALRRRSAPRAVRAIRRRSRTTGHARQLADFVEAIVKGRPPLVDWPRRPQGGRGDLGDLRFHANGAASGIAMNENWRFFSCPLPWGLPRHFRFVN